MGEAEECSSNAEASQGAEQIESAKQKVGSSLKTKGKAIVTEGPVQKKQRVEPFRSAASANIDVLAIYQSLAEMEIPSLVHEENVESVNQEDEQPPSPTGTKILESENEMDVEEGEFQEGMISALGVLHVKKATKK